MNTPGNQQLSDRRWLRLSAGWLFPALIGLALVVVLVGGYEFYRNQEKIAQRAVEVNLATIAQLKSDQISNWRRDRLLDAQVLMGDRFFEESVARWLANPQPEVGEKIRIRFYELQKYGRFHDVLLVDPQGQLRLSLLANPPPFSDSLAKNLVKSFRTQQPVMSDLYLPAGDPMPHLEVIVPLFDAAESTTKPVGAIVLRHAAADELLPMIKFWPAASASAETELVRRDSNSVLFLNELRYRPEAMLKLKIPLDRGPIPAVQAALGREGDVRGTDYRGVKVLANLRQIPGSPWAIVVKIDEDEALAEWSLRSKLIGAIVLSLTLILAAVAVLVWRERKRYGLLVESSAALRQANRAQRILSECNEVLVRESEEARLLNAICQHIVEIGGYRMVWVGFAESDAAQSVRPVAQAGFEEGYLEQLQITCADTERGRGPTGTAIRTGLPVVSQDFTTDPTMAPWREQALKRALVASVALPLKRQTDGHTFGALMIYDDKPQAFSEDELKLLTELANDMAYGIETLQMRAAQVRADALLRANAEQHRSIIQTAIDGFWVVDLRGRITEVNAAYCQMSGYSEAELLTMQIFDLEAAMTPAEVETNFHRITTLGAVRFESRHRHKDGSLFDIEASVQFRPAEQRVVAFIRDITDRKRAELAVQESENRFTLLFKHLVIGFALHEIICDADGKPCDYRFLAVNPAFEKLTGQKAEALIGRTVKEVWPETEAEWVERYGAVALGRAPIRFDLFFKALGRQYEVSAYSPAPRQFAAIVTDITDRKRAEAELRLQGGALAAAANAIVITDPTGKVVWANPAFTTLTGYDVSEVFGKNPRILKSGQHDAEFYRRLWATISAGQVWSGEVVNKRKDGTRYTEEMTITPVRNEPGAITNFIAIKHDITERKQMEEQLRESNRQLDQAVTDLQKTQQQVVQQTSLRALGQMASGMAHDFNNTLSPIIGFSELLLKHKEKLANHEEVARFLQIINTAGHDAADVVRRLREFGRQREMGELSEAIDLVGLIRQTIELTEPRWKDQAQAAGLTIQLKTEFGKVPLIAGEEFVIRELLTNLIFNAVDALPDGGTITLGTACEEGWVRLWVGDTGTGMTEEVRQRCFEPFFTTKAENGTGLGLAMVHGIVQRHGGTVEITSDLGKGTTFNIRLPVQLPKAASVAPVVESSPNRTLRVLVVDDEPMLRDLVEVWLTEDGHTVATAANGMEALTRLRVDRFDVVITDKAMPKMNGEQLAVAIHSTTPELPVILMTGFGEMMKASGEMPVQITAILSKPITQESLRAALAQALPA